MLSNNSKNNENCDLKSVTRLFCSNLSSSHFTTVFCRVPVNSSKTFLKIFIIFSYIILTTKNKKYCSKKSFSGTDEYTLGTARCCNFGGFFL